MPMKRNLTKTALAALLVATAAMAQTPYDEGQKALREQNWMEAAEQFQKAAKDEESQADAAMYWRAYALYKANRKKDAERELRRLERKYPESDWVREGQALRIGHGDSPEAVHSAATGDSGLDEELRLYALAQLMERDPERALPLLLDLAHNAESEEVRRDALFVLGVSESPAARQALAEIARNSDDPTAQIDAIHMLGTMDATAELEALYPKLENREARVAVIESFSIAGDNTKLKEILATETDFELRKAAIYGIAMEDSGDAAAFLESIYATASPEEKAVILEALTILEDGSGLALTILRSESDPDLQRRAIQVLGVAEATDELAGLYATLESRESRIAVLEAMSISEDSEGLYRVLREEQDPELRATAIQLLGISGGSKTRDYLVGLYPDASRDEKSAVITSLMIMEDSEGLIGLMKKEQDPELRREMLQMLTIMDTELSDEALFELLEEKG